MNKDSIVNLLGRFKRFFKNVFEILQKREMVVLPGQLAFSIILSIVPIITLIGYGASYFNISMDTIIIFLRNNFSDSLADSLIPMISGERVDFNLIFVLGATLYFASNGPDSIIFVANEIYGYEQEGWFKRRFKAMLMTFLLIVLYLFILLVPVFGTKIIDAIDYFNIKSIISSLLMVMQGPISWLIIFIFIKVIFTLAPNRSIEPARINIGSIFTTFGLILVTNIYMYYVNHFAKYDLFYAGLSNVMVLILWIYFLSYIFVIGLSLTTKISDDDLPGIGKIKDIK